MRSEGICEAKSFLRDDSAWADFFVSKAALILASVILFSALFQLAAGFKDFEAQEQLDFLARDFKTAVDEVGAGNFRGEFPEEFFYHFDKNEIFLGSPFGENIEVCVSGEYVHLKGRCNERDFIAVRPFAFRVLPFNESTLRGKLNAEFGADGSSKTPLTADLQDIQVLLQGSGVKEVVLNAGENITIKKEHVYVKDIEGVSAIGYVLVYQ